ncbi:lengsin [Sceloporus undulatus]|uniref:lengsin n=1 Tax=Sceloporus undulatus TaxID=8520 RepID=UPI001C4B09A4|nr:lengsin [Sceloporus undulatus]
MFIVGLSINVGCSFLSSAILGKSIVQMMDTEDPICQSTAGNENQEADGNRICGLRRERGVKVTEKQILIAGCDTTDTYRPANMSDQIQCGSDKHLQKLLAMQEAADYPPQNCHTEEDPQEGREDTCESSSENQTLGIQGKEDNLVWLEPVGNAENAGTFPQNEHKPGSSLDGHESHTPEKKTRDHSLAAQEKEDSKDSFALGSGISKETLQELKNMLRESPLLSTRAMNSRKSSRSCSHIPLMKTNDKRGWCMEIFHPHLSGGDQKVPPVQWHGGGQGRMPLVLISAGLDEQQSQIEDLKNPTEKHQISSPNAGSVPGTEFDLTSEEHSRDSDIKNPGNHIPLQLISEIEHIKEQMARDNIRFVRFEATDLHGVSRSKSIPSRFFRTKAIHGVSMPRCCLELTLNPKINEINQISASNFNCDIVLSPDLSTFRALPWAEETARVICDSFTVTGSPLLTSPRHIAKQQLIQLQDSGFALYSSFTYEFCIYGIAEIVNSKTISFPAATILNNHDQSFIQELIDGMYHAGANIESFSSSTAPGQMEISLHPEFGIGAADNAFTFRTGIKEVARKYNYIASFFTENGFCNSGTFSHSLWDSNGQNNLFSFGSGAPEFTDIGKNWLAGLLVHSAALSCLMAPTTSCRKRYTAYSKDSKDTVIAKWACNDNSSAFNLKSHGERGPRIENKLGSATANPYLVLSATIAAGLDGIKRRLSFQEPSEETESSTRFKVATIPLKLEDALVALLEDECIREALGDNFVQYFVTMKQYEMETEEMDVERNKFFEYFI